MKAKQWIGEKIFPNIDLLSSQVNVWNKVVNEKKQGKNLNIHGNITSIIF